jgi:hypothetical protein
MSSYLLVVTEELVSKLKKSCMINANTLLMGEKFSKNSASPGVPGAIRAGNFKIKN